MLKRIIKEITEDIINEQVKTYDSLISVDFSTIPKWAKWLHYNAIGEIFASKGKPDIESDGGYVFFRKVEKIGQIKDSKKWVGWKTSAIEI